MNPAKFLNYLDDFLGSTELLNLETYESQLCSWSNAFWVLDSFIANLKHDFFDFHQTARVQFTLLLNRTSEYAVERRSDDEAVHFYCLMQSTHFCNLLKSHLIQQLTLKIFQPNYLKRDVIFSDYSEFFYEIYDPTLHCHRLSYLPLISYFFAPKDYFVYTCLDWLTERNLYQFYDVLPCLFFDSLPLETLLDF